MRIIRGTLRRAWHFYGIHQAVEKKEKKKSEIQTPLNQYVFGKSSRDAFFFYSLRRFSGLVVVVIVFHVHRVGAGCVCRTL